MSFDPPTPQTPPAPVDTNQTPAPKGNFFLGFVGAVLGAVVVSALWVALAKKGVPEVAWGLSILMGGLSGLLAVYFGGKKSVPLGVVVMVIVLVTIVGSSYAAYSVGIRSEPGRTEYKRQFVDKVESEKTVFTGKNGLDIAFEAYLAKQVKADSNPKAYLRWLANKGGEGIFPALMCLCGIAFGFVTAGLGSTSGQCKS
ncbi:MAG: hypothetical protein HN370_01965 [Phycisphaerales bacterium]|jgi:hypothetical protein|nr:hypothetical protein [Phycisphaerales bacterium]